LLGERGQYEKAIEMWRQAGRISPDWATTNSPGIAYFDSALQRFDEARQILRSPQQNSNNYQLHLYLYGIAFLGADSTAMEEQERWFAGRPEYENIGLDLAADTEAYGGHLAKARELKRQAVDSAIRADQKETAAGSLASAAMREAAYGNAIQARKTAAEALQKAPTSQGTAVEAVLALAVLGDTARAESLAQDLGKRFPVDTQMQLLWLPSIQAQLSLDKKKPAAALTALQAALPIELSNTIYGENCLHYVYIRGEAYLAAGQGSAAAAEFQKILDHSGIVWNCWTGALAHLGVARANALQARTSQGADADAARVRALAAYKDFLTLWKDADPDIPILKQAKAEYANLLGNV
jgi:eukaryotic-like serine/threonine-protein kinase